MSKLSTGAGALAVEGPFDLPSAAAQVYLLLSCCPCEGKIAAIVDVPNACCTIAIPTAIFDQVQRVTSC